MVQTVLQTVGGSAGPGYDEIVDILVVGAEAYHNGPGDFSRLTNSAGAVHARGDEAPGSQERSECKEYTSNYRKLATKTVYLQPEQQHEQ